MIYDVVKRGYEVSIPPQQRTEAEVIAMTKVELFNALLSVLGIVIGAVALGIALAQRYFIRHAASPVSRQGRPSLRLSLSVYEQLPPYMTRVRVSNIGNTLVK